MYGNSSGSEELDVMTVDEDPTNTPDVQTDQVETLEPTFPAQRASPSTSKVQGI